MGSAEQVSFFEEWGTMSEALSLNLSLTRAENCFQELCPNKLDTFLSDKFASMALRRNQVGLHDVLRR